MLLLTWKSCLLAEIHHRSCLHPELKSMNKGFVWQQVDQILSYWITLSLNLADDAEEVISWLWITACCHLQFLMNKTQNCISGCKCRIEWVQSQPREEYLSVPMVDGPPQLESLWEKNLSEAPRCARGSAQREDLGRIGWFCAAEDVDKRLVLTLVEDLVGCSERPGLGRGRREAANLNQWWTGSGSWIEQILVKKWFRGGYIVITVNGSLLTQHP